MKISIKNLRRLIRETIEEVSTPGDTRYGMAGDARGGVRGGRSSRGPSFPGHSAADEELYRQAGQRQERRQMGFEDPSSSQSSYNSNRNQQGLAAPGGSYVQGVGWVDPNGNIWHGTYSPGQQDVGDAVDANMQGGGMPKEDFFLIVDSQVTRGTEGDIEHVPSGNIFTAQGDKSNSGNLLGDLNLAFQKSARKNGQQRAKEVTKILMDYDLLSQQDIDAELLGEIGVKGRDSKKIYSIEEYFMEFNNGFIKESKRAMNKVLL
jgi:hypothetical protein